MIAINELRFNNWVLDGFGNPVQILDIISEGNTSGYKLATLSPIPLSPEILEKAGIERTGNLASTAARKFYRIGRIIFESIPDNRVAVYIDSETESILIGYKDYLHQLQNLVFDISGQELTINLK